MPFGHDCPFNGYDYTSNQIAQITARCGCASHSDFQSERDKVISILLELTQKRVWCADIGEPLKWYVPLSIINEKIEKLRQAGEP